MHHCDLRAPYGFYGLAATDCYEDSKGRFFVSNGEYGQQVNYCPACGAKAPVQREPGACYEVPIEVQNEWFDLMEDETL